MQNMSYTINPVLMTGTVKKITDNYIKIYLRGRLGVIYILPELIDSEEPIEPGHTLKFYFSYIWTTEKALEYDYTELMIQGLEGPALVGGVLTEVNDTAARIELDDKLGSIAVPRRWMFTEQPLEEGQRAELYLSRMQVTGKVDLPIEMI